MLRLQEKIIEYHTLPLLNMRNMTRTPSHYFINEKKIDYPFCAFVKSQDVAIRSVPKKNI